MKQSAPASEPSLSHPQQLNVFSRYQKFMIGMLAFLQFTIILDFMIISPLGVFVMPAMNITAAQFSTVVSAYAFSAGISGLLAAGFADRFDRKKLLLFFYSGFVFGTLLCGVATSYEFLLGARIVTGLFGGVIGSIVLAITTDIFPMQMRGRVMGVLQTAFAASQVMGLPAGIFFSNHWGWQAPFYMIVTVAVAAGGVIFFGMKPIDGHLKLQQTSQGAVGHLFKTLLNPHYTLAFALTALLSTGGFMLMPFGSAFSVHNLGIDTQHLPILYMITGMASIFIGPLVGRAADAYGKFNVFTFGAVSTTLIAIYYTNMGPSPLWLVIIVYVVLFVSIFSRVIPAQALTSAIPEPANRGAFMAVSSSLQQVSGGVASLIAGAIVTVNADGSIGHFPTLGLIMVGTVATTLIMMYYIHRAVPEHLRKPAKK